MEYSDFYTLFISAALLLAAYWCGKYILQSDKAQAAIERLNRFAESRVGFWSIFVLISALFFATRMYRLGEVPRGIHVDEAGMAYDAWCLANCGVDRWLNKLPVYLINFDMGQSALYAYIAAVMIKIFGYSMTAIRLPAVIGSGLTYLFGSLIGREAYGRKGFLLTAFLITVCPYFLMASRVGLDCNLMLGFFTLAVYLLCLAVKKGKAGYYVLAGVGTGLVLYTYALAFLIVPVFLLLFLIYIIRSGKFQWKNLFALGIPVFIMALPLMLFVAINTFDLEQINTPLFTIPKLFAYRGSEISLKYLPDNLVMLRNILTYGPLVYNAFPEYGTLYYFSIPLVITGAVLAGRGFVNDLKAKRFSFVSMVFLMGISVIGCNLCVYDSRVINKDNAVFFSLAFFIVVALRWLWKKKRQIALVLAGCYLVAFIPFARYYYTEYENAVYPQEYYYDDVQASMHYIEENLNPDGDKTVYVTTYMVQQPYIYIVLEMKMSPYEFIEARNSGTNTYGNYCLAFPEELDMDGIYIINGNEDKMALLEENGFTYTTCGRFRIYYRQ